MNDWRNRPVDRTCRHCGATFEGKYNSSACQGCRAGVRTRHMAKFKESNPGYWRDWARSERGVASHRRVTLSAYGLAPGDFDRLAAGQGNVCAICSASPGGWKANGGGLVVDHCHSTGIVRGLLCPPCNRGLGQFEDNPDALRRASEYLLASSAARQVH